MAEYNHIPVNLNAAPFLTADEPEPARNETIADVWDLDTGAIQTAINEAFHAGAIASNTLTDFVRGLSVRLIEAGYDPVTRTSLYNHIAYFTRPEVLALMLDILGDYMPARVDVPTLRRQVQIKINSERGK